MTGNWQVHVAFEIWGILFCFLAATAVYLSTEKKKGKMLWLTALFVTQALVLLFDALAWLYRGNMTTVGYYMVRISNAAVYVLNYSMIIFFTGYLCACIGIRRKRSPQLAAACGIAFTGMVLILITQFYPLIYRFDGSNRYVRADWFLLSHVLAFFGMFLEWWMLIRYRKSFEKGQLIALYVYLFMPLCAIIWQSFFYGISMLQILDTVALMFLFAVVLIGQSKQVVEQEREINDMKIQIVISQIQPHFLYNTLNTIMYLCDKDPATAKRALGDFSLFLRGNMDSLISRSLVPLDKELRHVERYLELEKLRMGDELNVIYDISDNGFMLPPLTLQPLVENAVQHGLAKSDSGGTLVIRTRRTQTAHEIMISDDGVGFDVRSYMEDNRIKSVGIENVRKRLWGQCSATMEISSELGKGTKVLIHLPVD